MKKKIALLLAAVMTVGSLPMTAFASTENTVSSIKTVEDGDPIAAKVFLDEFKGIGATDKKQTVRLTLTNAKFTDANYGKADSSTGTVADAQKALEDAIAAAAPSQKLAIETAKGNLETAKGNLETAKAAIDPELQSKITTAESTLKSAKSTLEGYVGTDGKSGSVGTALSKLTDNISKLNAVLNQDGDTGSLVTALTTEKGKLTGGLAGVLTNGEITLGGTSLNAISDFSTGYFETSNTIGSTIVTNTDFDSAYQSYGGGSTVVTNAKAIKLLTTTAEGYSFVLNEEGTTYKGLGADDQKKVRDVVDALNAEYSKLVEYSKYIRTVVAPDLQSELVSASAAKTSQDNAQEAYDKLVRENEMALANLQAAQADVAQKEGAYITELSKDPTVWAAYQKLVAAQGGSSSSGSGSTTMISGDVTYTKISDTEYMAEFDAKDGDKVELEIFAEADGSGDASVTIESVDSVVSSQTLKIANIASGATTTTISGTTSIKEKGSKIKNVVITETTAGSIEAGTMKLRLTNGFTFTQTPSVSDIVVFPNDGSLKVTGVTRDNDNQDLLITFTGSSKTASTISVGNLYVGYDEDDVEVGDECEITVSDAGTTKQSIVVGKASDYTVSFTAEDKDLPTFYAGTYSEDTDSLVVTLKEELEDAWITGRSTKIVFPEGVEVVEVNVEDKGNTDAQDATNSSASNIKVDENEVDLGGVEVNNGKKAELELSFTLSVSPEFTGDIEATLTGSGIGDDQTVVVGTAAAPVKVEADINELPIDYRKTEASDIVITEAAAGVLKKDTTVRLAIDGIAFDGDPTVEVESGDLKIENVKIKDEYLTFDVKTESQKEAAVIRISDVNLNMNRSLPAGDYDLLFTTSGDETNGEVTSESKLSKNAIIRNYNNDSKVEQGTFDVDEITALKGYVTVVTAGRDQDDSTFTTKVTVTIGASTMKAGTKDITLDVPAYISNGYTMMPVRAVTEALSGSAIVRWDDPTKTVTITFGQRVISMTVGSNVMKINGVDVAMQAQCEITDSRAFIPLRDLGYALGLNDSKIAWDDATKTATLN